MQYDIESIRMAVSLAFLPELEKVHALRVLDRMVMELERIKELEKDKRILEALVASLQNHDRTRTV